MLDLAEVAETKGNDLLLDAMAIGNKADEIKAFSQARGFRYELEVAAFFKRAGLEVVELTKKVRVVVEGGVEVLKTDIDVVIRDSAGKLIYVQAKNGAGAFSAGGIKGTRKWIRKALADLKSNDYSQIIYVTPDPDAIPSKIFTYLTNLGEPGKRINIIPIPHL